MENDESREQVRLFEEFWSNMTQLELIKGSLTNKSIKLFANRPLIPEKSLVSEKFSG